MASTGADVHGEKAVDIESLKDHKVDQCEDLVDQDVMLNAFDGENREHEMGMWEAAKKHPMACIWAFTFCFTIVSCWRTIISCRTSTNIHRLWNHLICF